MMGYQAEKWIDLGEWGKRMDEFKLPPSAELSGKELKLRFASGDQTVKYTFHDDKSLTWETSGSLPIAPTNREAYEAIRVAPETYFVDFISSKKASTSTSLILDLNTRKATVVTAIAPAKNELNFSFFSKLGKGVDLSATKVDIQHALINPTSANEPVPIHEITSELVGKRIRYTYGRDRVYEHIYLNERFYTWHCLVGPEQGLADTEVCNYFKISPDVYLFTWSEKIMPTFGLVMINLKEMRSNGKTFGLDITSGAYINFTMGAKAEFLNETKYPTK
jgi:hypothetical protein